MQTFLSAAIFHLIKMAEQIFISHSKNDEDIVPHFVNMFSDTCVKAVLMEYEESSREDKPNWMWIRDEILRSKALFLILTKNIVDKTHTQNWVAFEIGVASTRNPVIPVFLFKEQKVKFPVPYVSHYFDKAFFDIQYLLEDSDPDSSVIEYITKEAIIKEVLIDRPTIGIGDNGTIKCPKCFSRFRYWGREKKFKCPCCSNELMRNSSKPFWDIVSS
jgi:hypothetical protein